MKARDTRYVGAAVPLARGRAYATGLVRIVPGNAEVLWRNTIVTTAEGKRLGRGDLTDLEASDVAERMIDEAYDARARERECPACNGERIIVAEGKRAALCEEGAPHLAVVDCGVCAAGKEDAA